MFKHLYRTTLLALLLSACANNGSGGNQFYGEIKGGIESSRSR